jgi:arginine repressor
MSILRENRRKRITDYISKNPTATQNEIAEYLNRDANQTTSQSTVLRDLKDLGYEKADGKYVKTEKRLASEQVSMLKKLFFYDEPRIISSSTEVFQVIISTKRGMEKSIADLISQIYENQILGTITGNGCVIILTTIEKNAAKIKKTLKSYLTDSITL